MKGSRKRLSSLGSALSKISPRRGRSKSVERDGGEADARGGTQSAPVTPREMTTLPSAPQPERPLTARATMESVSASAEPVVSGDIERGASSFAIAQPPAAAPPAFKVEQPSSSGAAPEIEAASSTTPAATSSFASARSTLARSVTETLGTLGTVTQNLGPLAKPVALIAEIAESTGQDLKDVVMMRDDSAENTPRLSVKKARPIQTVSSPDSDRSMQSTSTTPTVRSPPGKAGLLTRGKERAGAIAKKAGGAASSVR